MAAARVALGLCSLVLVGCADQNEPAALREPLPSVHTKQGLTGRTLLPLPAGPCVIFHFSPADEAVEVGSGMARISLEQLSDSERRLVARADTSTFNCATFALCESVPLTARDWVDPIRRLDTYYTNPALAILDSYFEQVGGYALPVTDWTSLDSADAIQDRDVVCFVSAQADQELITHLAKVHKQDGRNWLFSKLGGGPVVKSGFEPLMRTFGGNHILVYRPKAG